MPATVTEPAARVFPRGAAILISVLWSIPAGPSASTVRRQNACTIQTTNAMQSMWTSRAAEPVTAGRRPVQRSGRPETVSLASVQLTPFAKRALGAFRCFAALFAHRRAFPQAIICCSNSCKHDLLNTFGLAELVE